MHGLCLVSIHFTRFWKHGCRGDLEHVQQLGESRLKLLETVLWRLVSVGIVRSWEILGPVDSMNHKYALWLCLQGGYLRCQEVLSLFPRGHNRKSVSIVLCLIVSSMRTVARAARIVVLILDPFASSSKSNGPRLSLLED